ncbi:cytochrome b/b6 domain-containing protein [Pyruvatibacter mobilis]|mgnify:CR=1 FL=1|uniref:cytochrome b/b6 domain-containing protein n=1 Tax=Pyruvatibacter mobilis TaxID=1712261 RepID=UPI003BADBCFD
MERTVKVWDPLVRLFHWSLVVSFAVAWLTADEWDVLHEWAGYAAAALIGFRLLWGLAGPRYARFRQFIRPPHAALDYIRASIRGDEPRYVGHNPAGAMMIVGLIVAMAGTALTGWMYTLDAFWGVEWVEETHELLANLMLIMVGVHVAGVILASLRHKENLVRAMINGRKRAPKTSDMA